VADEVELRHAGPLLCAVSLCAAIVAYL
jgi:hypothetical protein